MLSAYAGAANWVAVPASPDIINDGRYFIDKDSIERTGDTVSVWVSYYMGTSRPDVVRLIRTEHVTIDCVKRIWDGRATIAPETWMEAVLQASCQRSWWFWK